ncbi:MAG TPA: M42 family peptidase [Candidatus Aenigmarchaeota archaeon]|nr:MAG: M42 family peptidase [Candidatus Aenigmarchaeota archaeon]HDD46081.1 M42 family peptidase [Candidatus Aenigmarchaeota archaeon]
MIELLKRLVNACSVSGYENEVRELIIEEISNNVDEIKIDKIGNLIARKGHGKPKVMIAAHMDSIGLMVKYIDDKGFIRFEPVGGVDKRIVLGKVVNIYTCNGIIKGIVGCKPIHLFKKEKKITTPEMEEMYIDIGAKNKKDVEKSKIRIGDFITFESKVVDLKNNRVAGYGFDDKIGCLQLIEIAKNIKDFEGTLYIVGTIEEEIGLVGVRGSAFSINPDVLIALDTTIAGDTPDIKEGEVVPLLGKGPVLGIKDAVSIVNSNVKKWLEDSAKGVGVKLQYDVLSHGATDSSVASIVREGIPSGSLLIPTRYLHTGVEVVDMSDVKGSIKVMMKAIENACDYLCK